MNISKNFVSEEFLSESFHDMVLSYGWDPRWYINDNLVAFCEWLRKKCGNSPVTINDWKWGGDYNYSGFREPGSAVGVEFSQHRFKSAVDIKVDGYDISELRKIVVDNFNYINRIFKVTAIEDITKTPTWLHVDCRWTGRTYLLEF